MRISEDEKKHLIDEIESQLGSKLCFYLKFCSCEKYAQDVCNGDLYGNTAEFFRKIEIESGERGQGDIFELLLVSQVEHITFTNEETCEVFLETPKGVFTFQFKDDSVIPIVSFVGIPLEDMDIIDADENSTKFRFPFNDDEYATMSKRFGEYCVFISSRELEAKVASFCGYIGADYIFERVEYCSQNRIDRMQAFSKSIKKRFMYKNEDLAYQREYRLAFGVEIPEDHFLRIGKLETAKVIKSDELRNLILTITYKIETSVKDH